MKKPNLIIGKKHLVLASMTLILGLAVYINYVASQTKPELQATEVISGGQSIAYGDAQSVNGAATDAQTYFAQARIDRTRSRDEAIETLSLIMNGGDSTEEEQTVATQNAVALSELIETESKIENLIIAAGFEDCVVYLDGESASIVVKSDGLTAQQAAQIKAILLTEVDVANENIRIFDVN
ncbi:MAG: SpoIIIAH-like family protein [Oscillospiraceae bacterium]|nr:SpoIIIAH-like family protein [Oscillospiraceae bacterium]